MSRKGRSREQATRLQQAGADVLAVLTDVTVTAQVENCATRHCTQYGGRARGVQQRRRGAGRPDADHDRRRLALDVDVNVPRRRVRRHHVRPAAGRAGRGHIVNTASEACLVTTPTLGMYCATEHGRRYPNRCITNSRPGHRRVVPVPQPGQDRASSTRSAIVPTAPT